VRHRELRDGIALVSHSGQSSAAWFRRLRDRVHRWSNPRTVGEKADHGLIRTGTFKLISKAGRVERSVDAHKGAVVSVRWNFDGTLSLFPEHTMTDGGISCNPWHAGTAIATCGEDGGVKVWSRSGQIRSPLAQNSEPIHPIDSSLKTPPHRCLPHLSVSTRLAVASDRDAATLARNGRPDSKHSLLCLICRRGGACFGVVS
jgi:hypothetical protein